MASAAAKESQTATQTVSITAVPTTSEKVGAAPLVHKVSTTAELEEILGDRVKVVLIEFFAEWCGPCKLMAQKLEEWAKIYDVTIAKIDVDELEDVAIEYNVGGIPTFAFIKDKQKLEQLEGSHEDKIIAALEKYCKKSDYGVRTSGKPETPVSRIPAMVADIAKVNESEETEKRT